MGGGQGSEGAETQMEVECKCAETDRFIKWEDAEKEWDRE